MKIKSIVFLISVLTFSYESEQSQSTFEVSTGRNAISIGVYHKGETYINHYGEIDKGKGYTLTNETIYKSSSASKTYLTRSVGRKARIPS